MWPEWVWSPLLFKLKVEEKVAKLRQEMNDELNCGCNLPAWRAEYDTFMLQNIKYQLGDHETCVGCKVGPGVFEDNVHLLAKVAYPRRGEAMVSRLKNLKNKYPKACRHGLTKALKIETGYLKMGATRIHPYWREFCYWETGFGYVPYKDVKDLWPEVRNWLCDELILGGPLGETEYLDLLHGEARKFMLEEWNLPSYIPTAREWVKSGKWMEGKSGTGEKIEIRMEGKKYRLGSKPVEGVLHSDEFIADELFVPVREKMVVMQKSETMKVRPVAKTGNEVNRKMNYLSECIEVGLHGSKLSTLFAGEKGNEAIDMDLISCVKSKDLLKVPLDQGGFDQHQSKNSIMVVLKAVGDVICDMTVGTDVPGVWAALWDSLFIRGAEVTCGDYTGEWNNGLPSGRR